MEYSFAENVLYIFVSITGLLYAMITLPLRFLWVFITGEPPRP